MFAAKNRCRRQLCRGPAGKDAHPCIAWQVLFELIVSLQEPRPNVILMRGIYNTFRNLAIHRRTTVRFAEADDAAGEQEGPSDDVKTEMASLV